MNPIPAICLAIFLTIGMLLSGQAQESPSNDWEIELLSMPNALGGHQVQEVFQDRDGYLWFGSQNGLFRYDGFRFAIFAHEESDPNSISHDYVEFILQSPDGYLWVGSYGGGLNRMDPQTEIFKHFSRENGLASDSILCMAMDPDGTLWIGTMNGLSHFDPQTEVFKTYRHDAQDPQSLCMNAIQQIYFDSEGTMWVAASWVWDGSRAGLGGLHRYLPEQDHFIRYQHNPDQAGSLPDNGVWFAFEDSRGNFWVGTDSSGLHLMDRQAGTFQRFGFTQTFGPEVLAADENPDRPFINQMRLRRMIEDPEGRFWLATLNKSLFLYDPQSEEVSHFGVNDFNLPSVIMWNIRQARDGSVWLCGGGSGGFVAKVKPSTPKLSVTHVPLQDGNYLFNQTVFQDRDKGIWLGSADDGAYYFSKDLTEVRHFPVGAAQAGELTDDDIHDIRQDAEGYIWLGGWHHNGGLSRYDPRTGAMRHFWPDPKDPGAISGSEIVSMVSDKRGVFWVGTFENGLNRYVPETASFIHYPLDTSGVGPQKNDIITTMIDGPDGKLWIAGGRVQSGSMRTAFISTYDPLSQSFRDVWMDDIVLSGMTHPYSLNFDEKGDLWFCMREFVCKLDTSSGELKKYEYLFGGATNNWAIPAKDGSLYMGRGGGLYMAFPDSNVVVRLGLLDNEMGNHHYEGYYQIAPHTYLVTYGDGFYTLDTDKWTELSPIPDQEVTLSQLRLGNTIVVQGDERLPQALNETRNLEVPHDGFPIRIRALSLQYIFGEENAMRYRLPPFESQWRNIRSGQDIRFGDLFPGEYTLEVQARNSLENWGPIKRLTITVQKPWWNQPWAWVLYVLGLGGLIWGIVAYRTRAHKQQLVRQEAELAKERAMNERLQHIDKLKDQFLANTSHELRTPLNGIIGLSEAMQERVSNPQDQEELSLIISSGKRLAALVNDLLDFSKLKNFDLALQQKPLDLRSLVKVVLRVNQPLVGEKALALVNAVPEDLPAVNADENRLQQILHNLLANAIKFTETGAVTVGAELAKGENPDQVKIFVQDTGIGIPQDKLESIFEEFQQADGSISREFGGTGLGLTITRQLVRLHGGSMSVDSEEGKGSTFWFTLPLSDEKGLQIEESASLAQVRPVRSKKPLVMADAGNGHHPNSVRILIVDDEPINQQVLKNHLKADSFELAFASNGQEALEILESSPAFDLVLLDVMMPKMSGYEACEKIREKYLPSELPVIMVTAKNQVNDLVQGLDIGANDYIAKPFSKDEFLARIKTHLNLHQINTVTQRFVPTEFLRSLGKESLTDLSLGDQVEKEVTVLFSDIRNYTGLAETMSPEENFAFVNAYAGRMGPIIQEHHGFVNQYLGDGIMSIFQQSPDDALRAAIAMQRRLQTYNEKRRSQGRRDLEVAMGLHSGKLIMGIIGDNKRTDAATISDTVNTASRMESLAKFYGTRILLSAHSLAQLSDPEAYHFRYLGKVKVKGKQKVMGIYECLDGFPEALKEQLISHQEQFSEALAHYHEQQFSKAIVALEQLANQHPEDMVISRFLEGAKRYLVEGVPEDWHVDG